MDGSSAMATGDGLAIGRPLQASTGPASCGPHLGEFGTAPALHLHCTGPDLPFRLEMHSTSMHNTIVIMPHAPQIWAFAEWNVRVIIRNFNARSLQTKPPWTTTTTLWNDLAQLSLPMRPEKQIVDDVGKPPSAINFHSCPAPYDPLPVCQYDQRGDLDYRARRHLAGCPCSQDSSIAICRAVHCSPACFSRSLPRAPSTNEAESLSKLCGGGGGGNQTSRHGRGKLIKIGSPERALRTQQQFLQI